MILVKKFFKALVRRKPIEENAETKSRLVRCLNTFDLTALGVGATLGLGVYVLAGHVAFKQAGPAVIISFIIAAIASVFAGLCYAEFGARVPKAGSAYIYSYTTVGEFMAFVIGWNLILEYAIGTASVARGYSGYVDALIDNRIADFFNETLPLPIPGTSGYFDGFAFGLTMFLAVLLSFGVKESTGFTAIFTVVNLYAVFFVIIAGAFRANINNWFIPKHKVPPGFGKGGFAPWGFQGVMKGAATCFYGFVGFDAIASTGEEAKNPQRSIPLSISISLFLILLTYLGVASVSTLMAPYWLQGSNAPLTDIFQLGGGWSGSTYIITFGAITSLSTALLGSLFPLPRVLFAMSSDGLIPSIFKSTVGAKKSPIFSTMFAGTFAGTMAALFTTDELTDMMSIGTLLAYTLVALSVLILRYREDPNYSVTKEELTDEYQNSTDEDELIDSKPSFISILFNLDGYKVPNKQTTEISTMIIFALSLLCLFLDGCLTFFFEGLRAGDLSSIIVVGVTFSLIICLLFILNRQPQSQTKLAFKVPFLPALPIVSALFNFYLMYNLSARTWYRFLVWMAFGLSTYFLFSIRNSRGYLSQSDRDAKSNELDGQNNRNQPIIQATSNDDIQSNRLNNL
ncbi:cationic amino acid transporter 2-like [Panonychus citri]|uniref:cationic amino acid transporter 2-like n=1 Tax=Panonychus citri TaxID=50023 RepID=UPI00230788BE|nr:cationic amino acid transporter 2-like [Panonychus citri]XP_053202696.1 cationic amino acid transporter 2-like [Panonychus citri]